MDKNKNTISFPGSVILTINNLMGPGMLAIPVVFQQAGWFFTTLVLILFFVISSMACTMLCESIDILNTIVRKNPSLNFRERREFSNVVRFYFGDIWYIISQLAFNISLQILNIASIIVSAQAVDNLLIFLFQTTYAVELSPHLRLIVSSMSGDSVFPEDSIVLTLGYILLMAAFLPLGFLELSDNVRLQYISFTVMMCIMIEFAWHFASQPWHYDETPFIGDNMTQLVGILVFSFAFTTLVPSWYNEKHKDVSTNLTIWLATGISALIFIFMGLLAGWAYPFIKTDNVLNAMSRPTTDSLTRFCVFLFALGAVAPGIAVRSIMIRLNLSGAADEEINDQHVHKPLHKVTARRNIGKLSWAIDLFTCSEEYATFWGVIFPWLVSFIFYEGKGFAHLINWTSLTVNGTICFVLPFVVYLRAIVLRKRMNYIGSKSEKYQLLREEVEQDDDDLDEMNDRNTIDEEKNMYYKNNDENHIDDDDEDDDDDNVFPPSLALPSNPFITGYTLAIVLLLVVSGMLIFQISVNLFNLVFSRRDILE